jgi:hypothetical protein
LIHVSTGQEVSRAYSALHVLAFGHTEQELSQSAGFGTSHQIQFSSKYSGTHSEIHARKFLAGILGEKYPIFCNSF